MSPLPKFINKLFRSNDPDRSEEVSVQQEVGAMNDDTVEAYLKVEDLDRLQTMAGRLRKKYQDQEILEFLKDADLSSEQAISNILMYPELLPARAVVPLQLRVFSGEFGPYAFLATVCGLQDQTVADTESTLFAMMTSYIDSLKETGERTDFSRRIVNRILLTCLHINTEAPFPESSKKAIQWVLEDEYYSKERHNALLCLRKRCPELFEEEVIAQINDKEIQEQMRDLRDNPDNGKWRPHYAYIPNLTQLIEKPHTVDGDLVKKLLFSHQTKTQAPVSRSS